MSTASRARSESQGNVLPPGCAVSSDGTAPLAHREHPEPAHPYRTPFQRDRARVIHSRAFRRLAGKTQVFTHRYSDHFRSRLTHTMEVAQISRAVTGALRLNEDLAEALALAHDLGHPPFGHAGEKALDEALRKYGLRFDHNLHALRIIEHFEIRYLAFRGLNLTLGVREGIVKHSRDYSITEHPELKPYFLDIRPPLEAQLIDWADEIAYLTADMEDGVEAGILNPNHIRAHVTIFDEAMRSVEREHPGAPEKPLLSESLRRMLNRLVGDLVQQTSRRVLGAGISTLEEVRRFPERLASFSPEIEGLRRQAKQYLYASLYASEDLQRELRESATVVSDLFEDWVHDPSLLPGTQQSQLLTEGAPRVVADYIAAMTDNYILEQHRSRNRSAS